jgi:hypothetical protein
MAFGAWAALAPSAPAGANPVVAAVTATPSSNLLDGQSLAVTGAAPSSTVKSVVLIECDMTQSSDVNANPPTYDPNHCDTTPADKVTLPVNGNAFSGSFVFHDPLTTGGFGEVSCDAGCVLLADNPSPGDVSSETMVSGNYCNGVFKGTPPGTLTKSTDAGPSGSTVSPGQKITVSLTWNANDFGNNRPTHDEDCVEIGSTLQTNLDQEHKPGPAPGPPGPNSGSDTFTYVVPSGGTGGLQICDRGAVSGANVATEKSAILCYNVLGTAAPEVSRAILLPAAGALVAGGGLLFARRRQRTRQQLPRC